MTSGAWPKARIVGEEGFPKVFLSTFLERITAELAGRVPTHYIDFIEDRAIYAGTDVGDVASIPGLTGTLALSAEGHLADSAATRLTIPISGVTFPCTVMCEFTRTVDSGATTQIMALDDGTAAELFGHRISAADLYRPGSVVDGGAAQAAVGPFANTLNVPQRGVGSYDSNDVRAAAEGIIASNPDTAVTLPVVPTLMSIGGAPGATVLFTGYIRKIAVIPGASTDKELQAMSSFF